LGDTFDFVSNRPATGATPLRGSGRLRILSASAVLLAAGAFDLFADEPPTHLAGIAVIALAVGALRLAMRGRLAHLFTLINLGILVQPAAHALTKVRDVGAWQPPHEHVLPDTVWDVLLQATITLLVVLIAASEPVLVFVTSRGLGPLVLLVTLDPGPGHVPTTRRAPAAVVREPIEALLTRCRPRRGPPALLGTSYR
jgi:hypothetical protein